MTLFPPYLLAPNTASTISRKTAKKRSGTRDRARRPGPSSSPPLGTFYKHMMQSTFQQSAAALFLLPPALSCKTREISTCVSIQSPVSQVGKCALAERKLRSPERAVRAGKDSPTRPARRSS